MIIREQYRTLQLVQNLLRALWRREITGFSVWRTDDGFRVESGRGPYYRSERIRWRQHR